MQINQRVYFYINNTLHAGTVGKLEVDEIYINDYGWRMRHSVGETPEDAAQKLHEAHERNQLRIRQRIRGLHVELREINERVAAGSPKPTAEEIEAAHVRLALAATRQAEAVWPEATVQQAANFRHYTGVYEDAAR